MGVAPILGHEGFAPDSGRLIHPHGQGGVRWCKLCWTIWHCAPRRFPCWCWPPW